MAQMCIGQPCTPTDVVWTGGLVRNLPDRDQQRGRPNRSIIGPTTVDCFTLSEASSRANAAGHRFHFSTTLDRPSRLRLLVVLIVMGSSFLSEVDDASDQEGAPRSVTSYLLLPPLPQATLPRSGYRGSDLVHWPGTADFCDAAISSAIGGFADVTLSARPAQPICTSGPTNSLQSLLILWVHDLVDRRRFCSCVNPHSWLGRASRSGGEAPSQSWFGCRPAQ